MGRNQNYRHIPIAGLEIAAIAGLSLIDVNPNGRFFNNTKFVAESTIGGVAFYAIYQGLLTGLKTEALLKKGLINKKTQREILIRTTFNSLKNGASVSVSLGITLIIFPWLTLPISIFGLVGIGKASVDLFNAFWDGLDQLQRAQLLIASKEAGINLRRFIRGENENKGFGFNY